MKYLGQIIFFDVRGILRHQCSRYQELTDLISSLFVSCFYSKSSEVHSQFSFHQKIEYTRERERERERERQTDRQRERERERERQTDRERERERERGGGRELLTFYRHTDNLE